MNTWFLTMKLFIAASEEPAVLRTRPGNVFLGYLQTSLWDLIEFLFILKQTSLHELQLVSDLDLAISDLPGR